MNVPNEKKSFNQNEDYHNYSLVPVGLGKKNLIDCPKKSSKLDL